MTGAEIVDLQQAVTEEFGRSLDESMASHPSNQEEADWPTSPVNKHKVAHRLYGRKV